MLPSCGHRHASLRWWKPVPAVLGEDIPATGLPAPCCLTSSSLLSPSDSEKWSAYCSMHSFCFFSPQYICLWYLFHPDVLTFFFSNSHSIPNLKGARELTLSTFTQSTASLNTCLCFLFHLLCVFSPLEVFKPCKGSKILFWHPNIVSYRAFHDGFSHH